MAKSSEEYCEILSRQANDIKNELADEYEWVKMTPDPLYVGGVILEQQDNAKSTFTREDVEEWCDVEGSKHQWRERLKELTDAGLLNVDKESRTNKYSINQAYISEQNCTSSESTLHRVFEWFTTDFESEPDPEKLNEFDYDFAIATIIILLSALALSLIGVASEAQFRWTLLSVVLSLGMIANWVSKRFESRKFQIQDSVWGRE